MNRLIFNAADLRRVVEHSMAARTQAPMAVGLGDDGKAITGPVEAPAVLLVHEDGVYLMSNGMPADFVHAPQCFVAYAEGCNPVTDLACWDNSRDLVGGDAFSETLPWAKEIKRLIDAGAITIVLGVSETGIELDPPQVPSS